MTTRFEDGVSILGDGYEEDVLAIEKAYQEEKVTKSSIDKIVERSINEVELEEKSYTELCKTIENYDAPSLLSILKTLGDEGQVSEDALSSAINKMVNAMTDRSLNPPVDKSKMEDKMKKSDKEKEEKKDEKEETKENKSEVLETTNVPAIEEPESVSPDLVKLLEGIASKVDGIQDRITVLENRSANVESKPVVPEVKSETAEEKVPVWKNIITDFSAILEDAVGKSSAERRDAFQNGLTVLGQNLMELHNSLDVQTSGTQVENKSEVIELRNEMNGKFDLISQQLAALVKMQENSQVSKSTVQNKPFVAPPVDRSIQTKLQQPVFPTGNTPNPNGMSIADIVKKSTFR